MITRYLPVLIVLFIGYIVGAKWPQMAARVGLV